MRVSRALAAGVLAAWVTASGCTTLREIPRTDFASRPERKGVRVDTRDSLVYEFDYATFDADSLTGYRHRSDVEGPADELAVLRIALDDVAHLSVRSVDWTRTGIVGGGVVASVLAVGLARSSKGDTGGGSSSPGGPPRIGSRSPSSGGGH